MQSNIDIRMKIKQYGVTTYQVAKRLGIHENSLYRRLREELSEEEKQKVFKIIEDIKAEKYQFYT